MTTTTIKIEEINGGYAIKISRVGHHNIFAVKDKENLKLRLNEEIDDLK